MQVEPLEGCQRARSVLNLAIGTQCSIDRYQTRASELPIAHAELQKFTKFYLAFACRYGASPTRRGSFRGAEMAAVMHKDSPSPVPIVRYVEIRGSNDSVSLIFRPWSIECYYKDWACRFDLFAARNEVGVSITPTAMPKISVEHETKASVALGAGQAVKIRKIALKNSHVDLCGFSSTTLHSSPSSREVAAAAEFDAVYIGFNVRCSPLDVPKRSDASHFPAVVCQLHGWTLPSSP